VSVGDIYSVVFYYFGGEIVEGETAGTAVHVIPVRGGAMGYGRP